MSKVIDDGLKELEKKQDKVREAVFRVLTPPAAANQEQIQAIPSQIEQNLVTELPDVGDQADDGQYSGTGDLLLDSYYDLLNEARSQKNLKLIPQYAGLIEKRELSLSRRAAGQKGRRSQLDPGDSVTKSAPDLAESIDITNLGPHADEISLELIGMVKKWGIAIPEGAEKLAAGIISSEIKKRPAIIKDGLLMFEELAQRFSKKGTTIPGSPEQQGQQAIDFAHPEAWADKMGVGLHGR